MKRLINSSFFVMFVILSATYVAAETITTTMEEGQDETFVFEGHPYLVEVLIIEDVNPPTVTFKVNNQVSTQLVENQSWLVQGLLFYIIDIELNEAGEAGSGDTVMFRMTYDVTPPEAKITFNPSRNDIEIVGQDGDDPEVLVTYIDNGYQHGWNRRHYILRDDLLNELRFDMNYRNNDNKVAFNIDGGLSYNNQRLAIPNNSFTAKINNNKITQTVEIGDGRAEVDYRFSTNQTTITEFYQNRRYAEEIFNGVVFLHFITYEGNLYYIRI